MNSLSPTTVTGAAAIVAQYLGKRWPDNRKSVLRSINTIRNTLYNLYPLMFGDVFHCFTPTRFKETCSGRCSEYLGVTLPPDMEGVLEAWECGQPLKLRSRWREAFTGRIRCGSPLDFVMIPDRFPTERGLLQPSQLGFYAESVEDDGKEVRIEYRDGSAHRPKVAMVPLKGDNVSMTDDTIHELYSVVLPQGLCGRVTLSVGDYVLSDYAPFEEVPNYARFRLPVRCAHNIFIQGTRKFVPVWFDHDIVECGDATVLEFMADYVRHVHSKEKAERDQADQALARAGQMIRGHLLRQIGGSIQDGSKRRKQRNILPGYTTCR